MNEMTLALLHSENQNEDELMHYGIIGMKWGVRRFQPYPSDMVRKGKYVGPSSTTSGEKPTFREKVREYAKAGRALSRASEYSRDRRIANRAERMQRGFVKREQKRYDKAVAKGNSRKAEIHKVKLEHEKQTQEALYKLQQELTDQINASFATGAKRHPISKPVTKFFQNIGDFLSDLPKIPIPFLGNPETTHMVYGARRVVQNALEESGVMNKKVSDVIQQNLRTEIQELKLMEARASSGY